MSIILPEIEIVDRTTRSIRYLEHGWPTELCRWHSHKEYELHLIVKTRGKAFVGDYIGEFKPGALFLTGPNLPHNWVTDEVWTEQVPIRDMLVQFSHNSFDKLMAAFPEFVEIRETLELAKSGIEFIGFAPELAIEHLEAIRDASSAGRIMAFLNFMLCLSNHSEKNILSVSKIMQPEGNSKQARIGEVIDHIIHNFAEDLCVEKVANIAGMSPTTFSRNFQNVTGNKFIEFVNRVRIGQACSMLYASDEQVSTICYEAGFQNLANFNRHFLKMKKMTPTEYRGVAQSELGISKSRRAH